MKAVVMAGGEGSRLRPLTVGRPKPMVPIVTKPVMGHILDLLKSHGVTEVVVTLQYMASTIQDYFGEGSAQGMKITYVVEEVPLGTAGSVKNAARFLDSTFLVISGDALTDFDLAAMVEAHRTQAAKATLTLYQVPNPLEYGVIITDEAGFITQFLEKPGWGDVISDTVNTGIYVLEPEVLDLIPDDTAYDFSTELFPAMLERGMSLYGYVAQGYWCDVGNMQEYLRANADMLEGRVRLTAPIGEQIRSGVWAGEGVEIAPDAQIYGPVYLGNEVKIKAGATLHGPTVIRDFTVVDNHSRVSRSVLWRNTYVGESCELRGVIISRQCSIKSGAAAYEGVVIGDTCVLGENCVIFPDVKIWPNKEVEPGAQVRNSIIWGSQGRRVLFSRFGVTGVVNVDLTPEFAAKLGAALGATLPKGSHVAMNRDLHRSSRMIKRALISGLPSAGIHVWDLGNVAIPVMRHFVRSNPTCSTGVHVRLSPFDQRVVDIRVIDAQGLNQSNAAERAVERVFFREDFRRAYLDEIGLIDYARDATDHYSRGFLSQVDCPQVRAAGFHLVVDYTHGLAAAALADILNQLGVDVVPLNARMEESKLAVLRDRFGANQVQTAKIVEAVGADLGVSLDVGAEKLFIIDEQGGIVDDLVAGLLMAELALWAHPNRTLAIPVSMPRAFDRIAEWHSARIIRTKNDLHSLMLACMGDEVVLGLDGTGNFIFPDFQPVVDGMFATVRLLENLAYRQMPLSEVVAYLPRVHMAHDRINCPWEAKGSVMRQLSRRYREERTQTIDGLKILLNELEWVHITPSAEHPFIGVQAEAADDARAAQLVAVYREEIRELLDALGEG